MIVSIDIGGTNTRGVAYDGRRFVIKHSVEGNSTKDFRRCLSFFEKKLEKGFDLVLTGGGANRVTRKVAGRGFRVVKEVEAIGRGGMRLSGKRTVFTVSIGTGTAFVSVKNGKIRHIGGSGVGGGTIMGLSRLMSGLSVDETEKLARKCKKRGLDLTVRDIIGKSLGKVPADATASNFGKVSGKCGKADVAASLLNMIGESLGVMILFAAKNEGLGKNILLCGRVAVNRLVNKRIMETAKLFGGKAAVPKDAEYCAAMGAALARGG